MIPVVDGLQQQPHLEFRHGRGHRRYFGIQMRMSDTSLSTSIGLVT
jgi:hypothetical protein